MRSVAMVLLVLLAFGCGAFSAPSPTPGGMDDVIAALVLRGVTVHRLVSGNPGCSNGNLHGNAVLLEVAIDNQSASHEIYLFRWRRPADFDAAAADFDACVAEYGSLNPGHRVDRLEARPWRAYGPGWTDDLRATLTDALRAASGGA